MVIVLLSNFLWSVNYSGKNSFVHRHVFFLYFTVQIAFMKTSSTALFSFLPLLLICFIYYSCTKPIEDNSQSTNQFQWTHKGILHTTVYDTAYITSQGLSVLPHTLLAGTQRINTIVGRVTFQLTAFNVGTYNIGPGPAANLIYYIDDDGFNLKGVSGTLNITAYDNSRITGNFLVTLVDGSAVNTQLTGSFTDMPVLY